MITAEVTFSRERLVSLRHPMEYIGIDWQTYEDISEELGASASLHLTYNKGVLTIMPVTELHELLTDLLHDFIRFAGFALQIGRASCRERV